MSAIEPYVMTRCIKCITYEFTEENHGKDKQTVKYRKYPDLGELVEAFGTKLAWSMVQEWPENGALLHECQKCHYKWLTHTGDELFIDTEGLETSGD